MVRTFKVARDESDQQLAAHRCYPDIMAFFEYSLQIPGNRIGFQGNGGPFTLVQLKVIQEVITLIIFAIFTMIFFQGETLKWNHLAAGVCLVMAVYFVFMK